MLSTCCMLLNELWGGKKVIYHAKFSKEMQIQIHTFTGTHIPRNVLIHISPRVPKPHRHGIFFFQGEYFSPEEKQTLARARIRGQWYVFKETFPLYSAVFLHRILITAAGGASAGAVTETLWTGVSGGEVSSGYVNTLTQK